MIIKNISTPKELVEELKKVKSKYGYFEVLQRMDITLKTFEGYFTWNDEKYTRNCLARTEDFELMLMCWEEGQETLIHDYGEAMAWVHPICGSIKEERYLLSDNGTGLVKVSSLGVEKSEFSFLHKTGIHKYINDYEARSVSLHLYVKPVKTRKIYDCSEGFCKTWSEECTDSSIAVMQ